MTSFEFKDLPLTDGGPHLSNKTMGDPGDDRVHFTKAGRRFLAIVIDAGLPLLALWRWIDNDFLVYLTLTAVVLNSVVMQGKTGYSVGKRLLGLRLAHIPQDIRLETKVSFVIPGVKRCLIRWVLHIFDVPLFAGFFRCLWNTYGRSFADTFTKTVVVWDKRVSFMTVDEWKQSRRG